MKEDPDMQVQGVMEAHGFELPGTLYLLLNEAGCSPMDGLDPAGRLLGYPRNARMQGWGAAMGVETSSGTRPASEAGGATDPYIDSLLRRIATMREIGRPSSVAHLIGMVEDRLGGRADETIRLRLADAKGWLDQAREHEAANGPGSLVDRSHPVHLWALAEIRRQDELRTIVGRAPLRRSAHPDC